MNTNLYFMADQNNLFRFTKIHSFFIIGLLLFETCKPGGVMKDVDKGLPEPILFMKLALKTMKKYHTDNGVYPKDWYLLNITFVNGPYRIDDIGVAPTQEMGNRWHPKDCEFTYEITSADKEHFIIRAINQEGRIVYEINEKMDRPIKFENK